MAITKKTTTEKPATEAPAEPENLEQPVASEGHDAPQAPVEENATPNPTTEAQLTAEEPTQTVPVGGADATADATADGNHNGTENTHPQSPLHQGDLNAKQKDALLEDFNAPGAVLGQIAEKYGITPERVEQIVDDLNGVAEEDRG